MENGGTAAIGPMSLWGFAVQSKVIAGGHAFGDGACSPLGVGVVLDPDLFDHPILHIS